MSPVGQQQLVSSQESLLKCPHVFYAIKISNIFSSDERQTGKKRFFLLRTFHFFIHEINSFFSIPNRRDNSQYE